MTGRVSQRGSAPPAQPLLQRVRRAKKGHRSLRGVDFSESDLSKVAACKNCGWPVYIYVSSYLSADAGKRTCFHVMGRWGELSKCNKAEMGKPW